MTRSGAFAQAERGFWILFLFAAAGGFSRYQALERAAWLCADLAAILAFLSRPERYTIAVLRNWALFSWPALAILSWSWSLSPTLSAYHGVQLLLTMVVGIVLLQRFGLMDTAKMLFWAILVAELLSLALALGSPSVGMSLTGDWQGIFTHKNSLGSTSVLMFSTAAVLFWSGYRRATTLAATLLAVFLVYRSHSATSMLLLIISAGALLVLVPRNPNLVPPGLLASLGLAALSVLLLAWVLSSTDPLSLVLDKLGKDPTLTGRTTLWTFGLEIFRQHPILGVGYKAYWDSPATSSEYLKYFVAQDLWFFHNNFLEVAVALGIVGLSAFLAGIAAAAVVIYRRATLVGGAESAWSILIFLYLLSLAGVEYPLFVNHNLRQVLLVLIGSSAVGVRRMARSARRTDSPARRSAVGLTGVR